MNQPLALKEPRNERNYPRDFWLGLFKCHQQKVMIRHWKNQRLDILKVQMHVPELAHLSRVFVKRRRGMF